MKKQRKILLIGDNHPEMLAIAENLAIRQIDFTILLPVFFLKKEIEFLKKIPKLFKFAIKRSIPDSIVESQVKRPLLILEILIWFFRQNGFSQLGDFLSRVSGYIYSFYICVKISISRPAIVITYDTFSVKKKNFRLIVICPAIHPISQKMYIQTALQNDLNWPESVKSLQSEAKIKTINSADQLIVLSNFAKQTFVENGVSNQCIKIIHIGAKNIFGESSEVVEKSDRFEIIYLGRLTISKGLKDIIDTSWKLSNHFSFSLVGNCSDEVFEYITAKSNPSNVRIYRKQNFRELDKLVSSAQVMLHPSYFEGFSISCMEGLRSGLVPIFSTNSGVAEILRDTDLENLVISPGDLPSIVSKLEYLESLDAVQLKELGCLAKELSLNYSFKDFAKNLTDDLFPAS